jgi:hypothetical protein
VLAGIAVPDEDMPFSLVAIPLSGGIQQRVCTICFGHWTSDGHFLVLDWFGDGGMDANQKSFAIPLREGAALPPLPPNGIKSRPDLDALPGIHVIDAPSAVLGRSLTTYAFTRTSVHRNLYRIPLP